MGEKLVQRLRSLIGQGGLKEARGKGLLVGLEFADPEATQAFVRSCFAQGLILNWTLHHDTVVRLAPPLIISAMEMDKAVKIMNQALQKEGSGAGKDTGE